MKLFRLTSVLALAAASSTIAFGQGDDGVARQIDPGVRQRVEAARVGLITNRLELTSEQAEKFWPIYREFTQKRRALRQEFRQQQQSLDPKNPDQKKQTELVNLGLKLKQTELDLEKEYSTKLLTVITAQQLLSLRKAEQDFRQLVMNQLQRRRALRQGGYFKDRNQRPRQDNE